MPIILSCDKWQFALVYLDDMVIFSNYTEKYQRRTTSLNVIKQLRSSNKVRRRELFTNCKDIFGHVMKQRMLGSWRKHNQRGLWLTDAL